MYHDDDTDTTVDQLPSAWALSDEILAEMSRDLEDLRRMDGEYTDEDLRAMEEQQRQVVQRITFKTRIPCDEVIGAVRCLDREVRAHAELDGAGTVTVGATSYGRDVELTAEQHAALVEDARKRFNELAVTAIYAA